MKPIKTGRYRHYKGSEYEVIGTAQHSETEESLVVYRSCETGLLWVRPHAMFTETVAWDGAIVPRFSYVAPPPPQRPLCDSCHKRPCDTVPPHGCRGMGICYPCLRAWQEHRAAERRSRNPLYRAARAAWDTIRSGLAFVVLLPFFAAWLLWWRIREAVTCDWPHAGCDDSEVW